MVAYATGSRYGDISADYDDIVSGGSSSAADTEINNAEPEVDHSKNNFLPAPADGDIDWRLYPNAAT